ncbi:MAG: cytochrome b [Bacteroidota bacterium]
MANQRFSQRLYRWLDDRYQLDDLLHLVGKKYVPLHHHSLWYYFGGVTLFLFGIQVVTGILLLLYYKPSASEAFESIQFIMSKVQFGWLIRSVHSWSANLMILSAFIHMFSTYFTRAYRSPRELTWVSGVLMFFLVLGAGFSGYLLPWNELAFFATRVGTDIAGQIPIIGKPILEFLRGGEDVTGATLSRFFGFHVAIIPALITTLLVLHLAFIQRQGMSVPLGMEHVEVSEEKRLPFFPNFMLRDLLLWLIVLNVLAVLAVFFPWELGKKADPFASAPAGIRPEWYFLFMFQTLKFIPSKIFSLDGEMIGILLFGVAGVLWVLVPFLDTKSSRGIKVRGMTYIGIFIVMYIIAFTILGYIL